MKDSKGKHLPESLPIQQRSAAEKFQLFFLTVFFLASTFTKLIALQTARAGLLSHEITDSVISG